MTLTSLASQLRGGGKKATHSHLCNVINGRRAGRKTMLKLKLILPLEEWTALLAFRQQQSPGIDSALL